MLKRVLLAMVMLATSAAANADYTYNSNREATRLVIECRGYLDKFSVFLESSMIPGDASSAVTSVELGVVVATIRGDKWKNIQWDDTETTGGSVALEGSVSGGIGAYKMSLPEIFMAANSGALQTDQIRTFVSGLTLKTSIIKGKATLACKAGLRQIKTQTETKIGY